MLAGRLVTHTLSHTMSPLKVGVIRYRSVAAAIGRALGAEPAPDCRIGHGRVTLTFRSAGATRWSQDQQITYALRAAAMARTVLGTDPRRAVRARASRAIVVVYEDATLVRGCAVLARWECVVPSAAQRDV
jgi:hypothetical protein